MRPVKPFRTIYESDFYGAECHELAFAVLVDQLSTSKGLTVGKHELDAQCEKLKEDLGVFLQEWCDKELP